MLPMEALRNGADEELPRRESMDPELARLALHHGPGFGDHGSRVAQLAVATAEYLGLESHEIKRLWFGSLVHDLGKTDVDPSILAKTSALTDDEAEEIRRHPRTGYDSISDHVHPSIAEAVLCHHERWDGGGYPNGVKGRSIPLLSRIIFVVDAYDVMTTGRDYRPGLGISAAGEELLKWSGRQFDPMVVDAFASVDCGLLGPRYGTNGHHHGNGHRHAIGH
jgi:HD-GYP domain-containing protein (c-di-GMP phosphodiesterase class II)